MRDGKIMKWGEFFKKGWHGTGVNATYSFVYWFSLLASEKKLRELQLAESSNTSLSHKQLITNRTIVSAVITVTSTPFQIASKLKLSEREKYCELFKKCFSTILSRLNVCFEFRANANINNCVCVPTSYLYQAPLKTYISDVLTPLGFASLENQVYIILAI